MMRYFLLQAKKCQLPIFFLIKLIFWHTVFSYKAAVVEYLVDCTQWLL